MIERLLWALMGAVIALRAADVVLWSWWLVLAPFWVPWALLGFMAIGVALYVGWQVVWERIKCH